MSELNSKIQRLRNNKEVKTFFSNFAWLSALQFASYLFPLRRKFIPNILSTKAYRTIMNKFSCQSHRELFLRRLEIITKKRI